MKRQYSGEYLARKRQKYEEEEEEEGAFVVFNRLDTKITIRDLVDDWLETYNDDATTGLILAINCLTKFAGADLEVSADHLDSEIFRVIEELEDDADQEKRPDPPVWCKTKKTFRRRFTDFWKKLVRHCQHVILVDEYFLQNLIDWCTELSKSNVRCFREAGTECAFSLMQGLIETAVECEDQLDQCEARLERVAREDLVENLVDQQREKQATIEAIHNYCHTIFNLIFVRRYRDTNPTLRVMCLKHLGIWMSHYPSFFLEDTKLKYVGWCLSDKDKLVRLAAVDCIHNVYSNPENTEPMKNFFERFKSRLLEMSKDIDNGVAASSINLISKMLKNDLLKTNDGDDIQSYVYDQDPTIRQAAAQFIYHDSFVLPEDDEKDREQINRDDILEVLAIFGNEMAVRTDHQGELDTPANYLVHTMWDSLSCLKAWDVMINMLLSSERSENELRENALANRDEGGGLDNNSETLLLYLMLSCSKMAKGTLTVGSEKKKKKRSKQKSEEDAEIWTNFLEVLLPRIPEIFQIVQTDTKKTNALVQMLRVIPCEEWSLRKKKDLFLKTMQLLQKVYMNNLDEHFLTECATTLSHFVHDQHSLAGEAQRYAYDLAKQLKVKFQALNDQVNYEGSEEERKLALQGNLARIKCIKRAIHVDELNFDEAFKTVLNEALLSAAQHQFVPVLLEIATYDLWWLMCDTDFDNITDDQLESVRQLKNYVVENISYSLSLIDKQENGVFSLIDSLCELLIVLKPLEGDHVAATLNTSLSDEDMNTVLRIFADRFESLSDEGEDEFEDKVLTAITHCTRLCLSNPQTYGRFGALAISQLTRFSLRADDLIKHCQTAIKKNYGHEVLQDIQFDSLRHIFEDNASEGSSTDRLESVAKTLSKVHGVDTTVLDFRPIVYKCLEFGFKDAPRNMDFLQPSIKPFVQRCTKKHKQNVIRKFHDLSSILPSPSERAPEDKAGWRVFSEFHTLMRSLGKAAPAESGYDDDEYEATEHVSRANTRKRPSYTYSDYDDDVYEEHVSVASSRRKAHEDDEGWMPRLN